MMFAFPTPGSNDTRGQCRDTPLAVPCAGGAECDARTLRCDCPALYDPLDGCRTTFFEARPFDALQLGIVSLSVFGIALLVSLFPLLHECHEHRLRWQRRRKRAWPPTPMFIQATATTALAMAGVTYSALWLAAQPLAYSVAFTTGWSTVALVYHVINYATISLFLRAQETGRGLPPRWKVAMVTTCAVGVTATAVQYAAALVTAFVAPSRLLQSIIVVAVALGFGLPAFVYGGLSIWAVVWFRAALRDAATDDDAGRRLQRIMRVVTRSIGIKLGLDVLVVIVLATSLATLWMEPLLFDTIVVGFVRSIVFAAAFCSIAIAFGWHGMDATLAGRRRQRAAAAAAAAGRAPAPTDASASADEEGLTPTVTTTGSTASTVVTHD